MCKHAEKGLETRSWHQAHSSGERTLICSLLAYYYPSRKDYFSPLYCTALLTSVFGVVSYNLNETYYRVISSCHLVCLLLAWLQVSKAGSATGVSFVGYFQPASCYCGHGYHKAKS